jgi:hypothetical protein
MSFGDLKVQDLIYEDSSNNEITVVIADLATKANPVFSGTVTVPTATAGDNSTKAASTAFVVASFAPKNAPAFTGSATGVNLTLSGDLTVNGTTTTINTTTLQVEDKNIEIGKVSSPSDTTADGGGWTLLGSTNKTFNWLNSTDAWTSSEHIQVASGKTFIGDGSTLTALNATNLASGTVPTARLGSGTAGSSNFLRGDGSWQTIDLSSKASLSGATFTGAVAVDTGTNYRIDLNASDGCIEITRNAGGAFIDFKNSEGEDYDARIQEEGGNIKFNSGVNINGEVNIASAAGTSGQVLTSGGDGSAPSWANPAAGGNTVDLVADGAIAAGKPVFLTTAGKAKEIVQAVTERTSQLSSPNQSDSGNSMSGSGSAKTYRFNSITYSETSSTGGFFFRNYTTGNDLECRAFNLSSNGNANIPSASNVTVLGDDYDQINACWEATNNKFFIAAKRDADNKVWGTWVSVGSGTITASGNTFELVGVPANHPRCIDCGSGRVAVAYSVDWSSGSIYKPYVHMLDWNGSSNYQTSGGHTAVANGGTSSNPSNHIDIAWHASESKIIAVYHNENNDVGCKVGTITGTPANHYTSWGSEVTVASAAELPRVVVDVNTGKVVVTYVYTSSNAPYSKVGTISGTSISFGTEALVDVGVVDANNPNLFRPDLIYIKNLQKVVYGYTGLYGGNYYTVTRTGTVSGTGISWTNQFQHWSNGVGIRGVTMVGLNNSAKNKFVIGGRSDNHGDRGVFKTVDLTSAVSNLTDANDCIGFSSAAYSNGQTATIKTYGNTIDNLSGLTTGSLYYIQGNGTIGTSWDSANLSSFASNTPLAGTALSATKLLIRDPLART